MYIPVIRSWLRRVIHNPGSLMRISGAFLLCALPLVTIGWAWGIALVLARRAVEDRKLRCFEALRSAFDRRGLRLFIMGLLDICVFLALLGSLFFLLWKDTGLPMRAGSAFFIWIDLLILGSGIYRYPLAVYNEILSLKEIILRGFLMLLSRPGQTLLFLLASISALLLSALTGLALFLFAPGLIAFLCIDIYLARVQEKNG